VKDFLGTYSEYRQYMIDWRAAQRSAERAAKEPSEKPVSERKRRLSFKERQEMENLEKELSSLNGEKATLETEMNSGIMPYDKLEEASKRYAEIKDEIDAKEMRWLELSEIEG
jgi:ATP-binding cassette subfamily F protein uup